MNRCNMGYGLEEDLKPPLRCNNEESYYIKSCKKCSQYNREFDLINQAIESARCRIYRLRDERDRCNSKAHQIKAKNQIELMKVTLRALECYRDNE